MKSQKQNNTVTLPRVFLKLGAAATVALLSTHLEAAAINISTVTVGDIGNVADPATGSLYGSVGYEYQIGKYEVTNAQYAAFLNAVDSSGANTLSLYSSNMSSDVSGGITWNSSSGRYEVKANFDLKPVNFVSFYDAARFTNWLTTGTTETGVYNLTGGTATPDNGLSVTRTLDQIPGTLWAIASEDEWYKAAYYNGDGTYRTNPVTGTLSQSTANYYRGGYAMPGPDYLAPVDHYDLVSGAGSFYGTFQQGGNVYEWNDAIISDNDRLVRGGSCGTDGTFLASSARFYGYDPAVEGSGVGFRVAALASLASVPEPATYAALAGLAILAYVSVRRRR
ncbi:formylglycine-generating enzyme family protein [Geminisphaera colitermitum]|uniref:formylglycine-generating enzyme family protein n=1 Tax=Geminisphaera colitermitum TaxID=1148786 RepID=UPI000158D19F|nr:SUMF1/EgtB/PvdO family nonheme iron enzyme [Geminisphaera colitermitum]